MKYIARFSTLFLVWSDLIRSVQKDQIWSKCIIWFSNLFIFWLKWIRSLQNGSNLIKLDFWWNNHWNTSSDFKIFKCFLIRLSQICPKWIKLDQTWSHLISDEIIIEIYHQIFNRKLAKALKMLFPLFPGFLARVLAKALKMLFSLFSW